MAYYKQHVIEEVKQIDLLTYLQNNDPSNLVYVGRNTYSTKEHDSLKINNGKWFWFSRGFGGTSALDYLTRVEEKSFMEAMAILTNASYKYLPSYKVEKEVKKLALPVKDSNCDKAINYLISRGINKDLIDRCIQNNYIYQEKHTNNVVFVGYDIDNKPQYCNLRGTTSKRFHKEAYGSNKTYSFKLSNADNSKFVHLFESAIDLLSYASLLTLEGKNYNDYNLLSLAGVYKPASNLKDSKVPNALDYYLNSNKYISGIVIHFDNDEAGRLSASAIENQLKEKYDIYISPPEYGKDMNDYLIYKIKNLKREEQLINENIRS